MNKVLHVYMFNLVNDHDIIWVFGEKSHKYRYIYALFSLNNLVT